MSYQGFAEWKPMHQPRELVKGQLVIVKSKEGYSQSEILDAVSTYSDKTRGDFSGTFGYWRSNRADGYDSGLRVVKEGSKYQVYTCPGIPGEWMRNRNQLWIATVKEVESGNPE